MPTVERTIQPSFAQRRATSRFANFAFVVAVLPVALGLINERLIGRLVISSSAAASILLVAILLAEVCVFSFLCARFVAPERLQWFALAWHWAILDATVLPRLLMEYAWEHQKAVLVQGLLSSQLGVVVLWAVFGQVRWPIRWPAACTILVLGSVLPLAGLSQAFHPLSLVIAMQNGLLLLISIVLRTRGYQIAVANRRAIQGIEESVSQFRVADVLLWMTLLAVLLAIFRAHHIPASLRLTLSYPHTALMLLTGALTAVAMMAAVWSILAKITWFRAGLVASIALICAAALPIVYSYRWAGQPFLAIRWLPFLNGRYWTYFLQSFWSQSGWIVAATAMLLPTILFYRALGYRRSQETRQSQGSRQSLAPI